MNIMLFEGLTKAPHTLHLFPALGSDFGCLWFEIQADDRSFIKMSRDQVETLTSFLTAYLQETDPSNATAHVNSVDANSTSVG